MIFRGVISQITGLSVSGLRMQAAGAIITIPRVRRAGNNVCSKIKLFGATTTIYSGLINTNAKIIFFLSVATINLDSGLVKRQQL